MWSRGRRLRGARWTWLGAGAAISSLLLTASRTPLLAQLADTTKRVSVTQVPALPATLPLLDSVRVVRVVSENTSTDTTVTRAGIGDAIMVSVRDLRALVYRATCLSLE